MHHGTKGVVRQKVTADLLLHPFRAVTAENLSPPAEMGLELVFRKLELLTPGKQYSHLVRRRFCRVQLCRDQSIDLKRCDAWIV